MGDKSSTLNQLHDGDIVKCLICNDGHDNWFGCFDGVFNKDTETLDITAGSKFDFNNHNYHNVYFKFDVLGNINNAYQYDEGDVVTFNELLSYLKHEKKMDDLDFKVCGEDSAIIGYFDKHPVNVVEISSGFISSIVFGRYEPNQSRLNWLYYLKDKKINIQQINV